MIDRVEFASADALSNQRRRNRGGPLTAVRLKTAGGERRRRHRPDANRRSAWGSPARLRWWIERPGRTLAAELNQNRGRSRRCMPVPVRWAFPRSPPADCGML